MATFFIYFTLVVKIFMRVHSYFNTSLKIISAYDGKVPLHYFLKEYFSKNKKHGSRDRKIITHFIYSFYRTGFALNDLSVEEKLKAAIFLCHKKREEFTFLFNDSWIKNWDENIDDRIQFIKEIYPFFSIENIFPFGKELSESIDSIEFANSHLLQPNLFLRIRNDDEQEVIKKLTENKIEFKKIKNCLEISNGIKVENIFRMNKEVVVQDYSSQRVAEILQLIPNDHLLKVWDCCAGSGGKSILAFDILKNIFLTVSDVRISILQNLKKRFEDAGIKNYKSFLLDLTTDKNLLNNKYDLIICDAPCTGSGTWLRTPEQLFFFAENKIEEYENLQKKIVSRSILNLKRGGYFLYITCSVFKKENQGVTDFIQQNFSLKLIKEEVFKGYEMKADTMFAALFINL